MAAMRLSLQHSLVPASPSQPCFQNLLPCRSLEAPGRQTLAARGGNSRASGRRCRQLWPRWRWASAPKEVGAPAPPCSGGGNGSPGRRPQDWSWWRFRRCGLEVAGSSPRPWGRRWGLACRRVFPAAAIRAVAQRDLAAASCSVGVLGLKVDVGGALLVHEGRRAHPGSSGCWSGGQRGELASARAVGAGLGPGGMGCGGCGAAARVVGRYGQQEVEHLREKFLFQHWSEPTTTTATGVVDFLESVVKGDREGEYIPRTLSPPVAPPRGDGEGLLELTHSTPFLS